MSQIKKKLIVLLKAVKFRTDLIIHVIHSFKWLFDQIGKPRDIGTVFHEKRGKYRITYNVSAHIIKNDKLIELTEEISRIYED